jgi:pimeloyl-ACP methyl ester carboxylesterase
MPRSGRPKDPDQSQPRLRRAYYDCRYGQLHIHNAIPAGGGFDELASVICLHDAGETGQVFVPLLAPLGDRRSVYALDQPGAGGSDPAPGIAITDAIVHAASDFLDSMRIRSFDLLARGAAAAAALKLLYMRGDAARRVVLVGAPAPLRGPSKVVAITAADGQAGRILELLKP